MKLYLILGNCLFPSHDALGAKEDDLFFMAEDASLCTHFKYHKHKLILFLSSMRSHADQLRSKYTVQYYELNDQTKHLSYEDKLLETIKKHKVSELVTYDIEDKFFDKRIRQFCKDNSITLTIIPSQGFLTTKIEFENYLKEHKLFMQEFYIWQRKRLNILIEDGQPIQGKWSFDQENRKKLPKDIQLPNIRSSPKTKRTIEVSKLVNNLFTDHPGDTINFYLPTTRANAVVWLHEFLEERFDKFGPYEDAIDKDETFLFHSVLSPLINIGLLTPKEVVNKALDYATQHKITFSSLEGFIRQIIGWREFMRGVYHTQDEKQNFFNHSRRLTKDWYEGTTGLNPLDKIIKSVNKYAYAHHIERLMILSNIMLLSEIHPDDVYKWFMELFVDSSDWVMVPNVYGMGQYADGGIFATKPYISGSNYILKMSNFEKGEWTTVVDGLYWRFINKNREFFKKNYRMSMMVKLYDKMDQDKKEKLEQAAISFLKEKTSQ